MQEHYSSAHASAHANHPTGASHILGKESRIGYIFSLALLILVIFVSIYLYIMTIVYDRQSVALTDERSKIQARIDEISQDKTVVVTKILRNNTIRPSIDLQRLVSEFQNIAELSNVRLKGFSVKNDVVTTSLIATEGDLQVHPDPASTIIAMMREYMKGGHYFTLDPILSLSGDERRRTTNVSFRVRSQ